MSTGDGVATSGDRPDASSAVLRHAWDVVRGVAALAGVERGRRKRVDGGPSACLAALADAHRALVVRLVDPGTRAADRDGLGAAVLDVDRARESLHSLRVTGERGSHLALADMMERLRSAGTTSAVLERAPREIARLGYDRCMVSRVRQGHWIAESSYVRGDVDLARAMTLAGSESPVELGHELVESELVRRRAPMLVRDAQRHPRTHRRLIDLTGTTDYAAAPIVLGRGVVGFVHVDSNQLTGSVDEGDLAVLALVGQCLGYALERAIQRERLQALRLSIVSYSSSIVGLIDDVDPSLDDDVTPSEGAPPLRAVPHAGPAASRRHPLDALTVREREVLERIAAGEGNGDIAAGLFIAEATVKAHVKHIFRKLGVANRAEAVSRYLRG